MKTLTLSFWLVLLLSMASAQNFTPSEIKMAQNMDPAKVDLPGFISSAIDQGIDRAQLFSAEDRLDSSNSWVWLDADQAYLYASHILYTSDDKNNIITKEESYPDSGHWILLSLNTFTYDDHNNLVEELVQQWNGVEWDNRTLITYTFDINNDQTSRVMQTWNDTSWVNQSHQLYTYDGHHNILTQTGGFWSGTDWFNSSLRSNTYDVNNKRILQLIQSWNSGWENNQQVISTYDANSDLDMDFNQKWMVDHWVDNYRNLYDFDSNHNRTFILRQNPVGVDWENDYQFFYTYDLFNDITSQLYQVYTNNEWVNNYQYLVAYDEKQNRISEAYEEWDSTWHKRDSTHFFYTLLSSAQQLKDDRSLMLFPNPATTSLTIDMRRSDFQDVTVEIYSNTGIKVMTHKMNSFNINTIDVSKLLPGFYRVIIQCDSGIFVRSLIKL